jgi:hypothetical protein
MVDALVQARQKWLAELTYAAKAAAISRIIQTEYGVAVTCDAIKTRLHIGSLSL